MAACCCEVTGGDPTRIERFESGWRAIKPATSRPHTCARLAANSICRDGWVSARFGAADEEEAANSRTTNMPIRSDCNADLFFMIFLRLLFAVVFSDRRNREPSFTRRFQEWPH